MPDDPQSDAPTEVADVDDVHTDAQAPPSEASLGKSKSKPKSNDGKGGKGGKTLAAAPAKRRAAPEARPVLTSYGLASTFLGLVSVAALVFGLITWNAHQRDVSERTYRSQVLQMAAGWTSLPILHLIRQETLVMAGDDDPIVPLVNGRILARMIPNARLYRYHGGHVELVSDAATLAPVVSDFLLRD